MRNHPDRGYRPHASHGAYQRALGEVCRQRRRIGPQRVRDHTRRGGFRGLRRGADFRAGGLTMGWSDRCCLHEAEGRVRHVSGWRNPRRDVLLAIPKTVSKKAAVHFTSVTSKLRPKPLSEAPKSSGLTVSKSIRLSLNMGRLRATFEQLRRRR